MPQSWTAPFLSPSARRPFWRNSIVNISPFGVPNFVCVYQLFRVVVFPKEKSTFVGAPEFVNFRKFHICCISQGNTHSLERQRIVRFHIGFTFVARPC